MMIQRIPIDFFEDPYSIRRVRRRARHPDIGNLANSMEKAAAESSAFSVEKTAAESSVEEADGECWGRFTCYHGEGENAPHRAATLKDRDEIEESIKKFYVEAARRLPLDQMPELLECIRTGGHCIGLADPVSNIILNAISRLPSAAVPDHSPPPERSHGTTNGESNWMFIAAQSHFGLLVFMAAYFRYLTDAQARRYLDLASYDLSVAIMLVRHDRFTDKFVPHLLPDGGKIKGALKIAALNAGHPAPDDLAGLMTMQYPSDLLVPVIGKLQGGKVLSTTDVWEIKSLLSNQWPPTCPFNLEFLCRPNDSTCTRGTSNGVLLHASGCIGENIFARVLIDTGGHTSSPQVRYISNLTFDSLYTDGKLSNSLLENTLTVRRNPGSTVNFDAVPCDHILSLKMCLLDTIHALYIKALAILPSGELELHLLRALLVAGHCYGPMDPVSNIIMNSIWYYVAVPPLEVPTLDHTKPLDSILDTSSMSRLESRSLNGLVNMFNGVSAMFGPTSKPPLSEHEALEYLCYSNCNLTELWKGFDVRRVPFDAVADAAKHPQYALFGSFLMKLSPMICNKLQSLLQPPAGERISPDHVEEIASFLTFESQSNIAASAQKDEVSCCLSEEAALEMSRIKLAARDKLTFVHKELNRMLLKYCIQHPWEPSYKVDIICGVHIKSMPFCDSKFFHANFLAISDGAESCERILFFAEFSESPSSLLSSPSEVQSEPTSFSSSCCRIYDYHASQGRCSFCEDAASKIVHPPSWNELDGSISRYHSTYRSALRRVCKEGFENLLESDYTYFDRCRDVELGKIINDSCLKSHRMPMGLSYW